MTAPNTNVSRRNLEESDMDGIQIYAVFYGLVSVAAFGIVLKKAWDGDGDLLSFIGLIASVAAELPLFGRVFGWW
jgi:hypothetical protein